MSQKYIIYLNILELIKHQKLEFAQESASKSSNKNFNQQETVETLTQKEYVIIKTVDSFKNKKIFIYVLIDDANFYKSDSMLKLYKNISEIKASTRNYNLDCYTIGNALYCKYTTTVFPKISSNDKNSYIRHRFIPDYIFCINILNYSLLNYKYKIIEDKDKLFEDLKFNKYNGEWENILPNILYNDPIAIWIGLEVGDVLYYDGYYRKCVDDI